MIQSLKKQTGFKGLGLEEDTKTYAKGLELLTRIGSALAVLVLFLSFISPSIFIYQENQELLMIASCVAIITTSSANIFIRRISSHFGFWTCAIMFLIVSTTIQLEDNQFLSGIYFILPLILLSSFATLPQSLILAVLTAGAWSIKTAVNPDEFSPFFTNPFLTWSAIFISITAVSLSHHFRQYLYRREVTQRHKASEKFQFLFEKSVNPLLLVRDREIIEMNNEAQLLFGQGAPLNSRIELQNQILSSPSDSPPGFRAEGESARGEKVVFWVTHSKFEWEQEVLKLIQLIDLNEIEAAKTAKQVAETRSKEDRRRLNIVEEQARQLAELNEKISKQYLELEMLNREKDELMGIVAHDLKTPLAGIKLTVDTLLQMDDHISPEKRSKKLGIVSTAVMRITDIINRILTKDALDSGNINPILIDLNITPVLHEIIEQFKNLAEKKGITLEMGRGCDENFIANTDREFFQQILANLISNAIKYSPHHTTVRFSVMHADNFVLISVTDQGLGLSEEDKNKLFGKYQRLSSKPTGDEDSTGLGLYIVQRLASAVGGSVTAESPGKGLGSTFTVILPIGISIHTAFIEESPMLSP